jgi:hypothetical protein
MGVWWHCLLTSFGSAWRGALGLTGSLLPYPESGPSFTLESASPFLFLSKRGIRIRVFCLSSSIYSCISLFWGVWWQCLSTSFGSAWRGALGLSGSQLPYPDSGPSFTHESASPLLFLSKHTIRIRGFCLSNSIYSCVSLFWDVWWQCLSTSFGSVQRGALELSGSLLPYHDFRQSFTRELREERSDFGTRPNGKIWKIFSPSNNFLEILL